MQHRMTSADETAKALAGLNSLDEVTIAERIQPPGTDDPAVVARWMLDVIAQISAYDDQAVSHLVTGFLKHACGQRLLSVEKTAMHISGLAHRVGEKFSLSEEGVNLMKVLAFSADTSEEEEFEDEDEAVVATGECRPFAKMNFGKDCYEIAEGDTENDLIFRSAAEGSPWTKLRHGRESGWEMIGAEILKHSMDVFSSYVNLHAIRLDDAKAGMGTHVFEIDNIRWWLRINGTEAEFTTDLTGNWTKIPQSIQEGSIRELGIAAAKELIPNFRKRLEPDAEAWVIRMAHAAAITPIM